MSNSGLIQEVEYALAVLKDQDRLTSWYNDFKVWAEHWTSQNPQSIREAHELADALQTVEGHLRAVQAWADDIDLDTTEVQRADAETVFARLALLKRCPPDISVKHTQ